jgi:hypothetical protein
LKPPPEYADAFKPFVLNESKLHYRITITGTKYAGVTENAYNLKAFCDSAAKEGAAQLQGVGFGGTLDTCK